MAAIVGLVIGSHWLGYKPIALHPTEYVGADRGGRLLQPGMNISIWYEQEGDTDTLNLFVDTTDEATGSFVAHGENKWGSVTCSGSYSNAKVAFSMEYLRRPGLFRYYLHDDPKGWRGVWEHEPYQGHWQHGKAVWKEADIQDPQPDPIPMAVASAPVEA